MTRTIIQTPNAPAAIGPYSQANCVGNLIFTAGQVAIDPTINKLIDGDIQTQTRQVIQNLQAILQAGGSDLDSVVKTTVFLQDMAEFAAMNAVYKEFFSNTPPARSTVQVAALPLGARIEIEVVAVVK